MLTADNLAKRDSLLMLDEEAKQNIQSDIQAQHKLEQDDMQAARLK